MDLGLPEWLDMGKITGIAVLTLAFIQYVKEYLPTRLIKPCTLLAGVLVAYLGDCYVGCQIVWAKVIFNGLCAGVMSDMGYGFLSKKGGSNPFTIPSKDQLTKPGP